MANLRSVPAIVPGSDCSHGIGMADVMHEAPGNDPQIQALRHYPRPRDRGRRRGIWRRLAVRLSMPSNGIFVGGAALLLGLVLILHVAGTIVTGALFIRQQKALREQWRSRLYAFLGDNEYRSLVIEPVDKAEFGFWVSAVAGGILAVLIFIASLLICLSPVPVAPPPVPPPSASAEQQPTPPALEIVPARPAASPSLSKAETPPPSTANGQKMGNDGQSTADGSHVVQLGG